MDAAKQLANAFVADEMITIALEDGGNFTVQKALLCSMSDYFTGCLRSNMSENQAKEMTVPGCTTEDFVLLLYYACHQTLPDFYAAINDLPLDTHPKIDAPTLALQQTQCMLIRLWAYADSKLMRKLQDIAMERLLDLLTKEPPTPAAIRLGFDLTAEESPMRDMPFEEFTAAYAADIYQAKDIVEVGGIPGVFVMLLGHIISPDADTIMTASAWKALRFRYMVSNADGQD